MSATTQPVIGLVGSEGAYGRWLRGFFTHRMGLTVLGTDTGQAGTQTPETLLERCQVLVFCAPIRQTPDIITDFVRHAAGHEADMLWMDVTSVKQEPVTAMLASRADVVGLHPMTAAPKAPTLKGRVMVVCEARLTRWRPWFEHFLATSRAECVRTSPERHDRIMALVQAMVHATHLAQAGVLREYADDLGGLEALLPFRSASFELDGAILSRILAMNPAIYEDIQFTNPNVLPMLATLQRQIDHLHACVDRGGNEGRRQFREYFLDAARTTLGEHSISEGNYTFERVGYLLADLSGERSLSVHLPEDQPGSLRRLLHAFERNGVNIASIHSSRTPAGEVHFRLGFDGHIDITALLPVLVAIESEGIGKILENSLTH